MATREFGTCFFEQYIPVLSEIRQFKKPSQAKTFIIVTK